MTAKKPALQTPAPIEQWTTVQVASFLAIPYQTARNNMLAGDYGPSDYRPETRTLLVSSSAVREWKAKFGSKSGRKKTRKRRQR